jgi:hypothetical protein
MKYGLVLMDAIKISMGFAIVAAPVTAVAIDAGTLICFR